MKKRKLFKRFGVICLAFVCIGGAELAACYWLDRVVFHKITDPAIRAANAVWEAGGTLLHGVKQKTLQMTQKINQLQEKADIESQRSGSPAVEGGGIAINDQTITELVIRDGSEILTGGSMPIYYYAQSDDKWADKPFGSDSVGAYGCGPTAMSMAVRSLTGVETDPAQMSKWCSDHGYHAAGSGAYHTIVRGVSEAYHIKCEAPKEISANELRTLLSGGRIAVALMGAGHFTSNGHFILLRGVTLNGNILVADPNSRARSLQEWDAQLIIDELSTSRVDGAPLWLLSAE